MVSTVCTCGNVMAERTVHVLRRCSVKQPCWASCKHLSRCTLHPKQQQVSAHHRPPQDSFKAGQRTTAWMQVPLL